jgi:glutamyl-tRNA reductase
VARADIVISSTAAPGYVIEHDRMAHARQVNRAVHGRSCLMIDIALPRDIEPGVDTISDIYVYDLDDLNSIINVHRENRQGQALVAEGIIAEELDTFCLWQQTQQVVPTIKGIHAKADRIAEAEVARAVKALGGVDAEERKVLEAMAASIVTKVLHGPTVRLRKYASEPDAYRYTEAARFLFGLESNPEGVSRHSWAGVDSSEAGGSEARDGKTVADGELCSRCIGPMNPLCPRAGTSVCRYATVVERAAIVEMGPAEANGWESQMDMAVTRKGHHV